MQPVAPISGSREKSIWPMFAGAFVLFVLFAIGVLWMLGATAPGIHDEAATRAAERYEILKKVQAENDALLSGYAWADQAKGTVRLPLDRAMELTQLKLAAQGEPRPAYPVDPTVPLGSSVKPGGLAAPQPPAPSFNAPAVAPTSTPEALPTEVAP
jgi:hypothetical protein